MKKNIKNPRKGVTLVELMIALSIISIITIASISMMNSSIKIEVRASSVIEANKTVESIVEIFRYSDEEEEFEGLCKDFFNINVLPETSVTIKNKLDDDSDDEYYKQYTINRGGYSITIDYYYRIHTLSENEKINIGCKIEIAAKHSDGKKIYTDIIFIKG